MREIHRRQLRLLVRDLAELTGADEEDAVLAALQDRVARLKGPATPEERVGRALATLRHWGCDHEGRMPSQLRRDRALGYGKEGV